MTTTNYLIPLQNVPQVFEITLGTIDYFLTSKWNDAPDAGWVIDIADSNNVPLACNIPLITGADILSGLEYLEIPGQLIVYTNGDESAVPTLDNLGVDSDVYLSVTSAD